MEAADQILTVLILSPAGRVQGGPCSGERGGRSGQEIVSHSPAPVASGPRHRHHARTRHSSHPSPHPRQMQRSHKVSHDMPTVGNCSLSTVLQRRAGPRELGEFCLPSQVFPSQCRAPAPAGRHGRGQGGPPASGGLLPGVRVSQRCFTTLKIMAPAVKQNRRRQ